MQGSAADKKRTKRTKHSSWEFVFRIIPWFRSPFPVWVQAAAAVAIVVLTFFIFQVTDEQRKIARNANRILGLQSTIMAGQAVIMKNQSEIMKRQAEEAGAQSRILENNDRIVRAINRAAVYPEVGLTIFRAKN